MVLPFEGHSRQSKLMHAQVETNDEKYRNLWVDIIKQKISNQARALSIMGAEGVEAVLKFADTITNENVDHNESLAAKEYFRHYHEGLNRRAEDPVNSRLNYGYAVVDLAAHNCIGANIRLTKPERQELAEVLYNACICDGSKVNIMTAIELMVESLKRIILDCSEERLKMPVVLPVERLERNEIDRNT